jgi:hypothetical protein
MANDVHTLRHWRYISSFHGPWLQIPPEILETLANANYNTPRPHPVDPAVFFDLIKIRRLVEDATTLAVRAATGVASSQAMSNSSLGLGFGQSGGGNPGKLSRERKHRMREQASQKLSRAYHLDEIACSVATMQSASSLEDVASLVLQRNKDDPDAKYVHFFHEKIPSRQLAECTSLDPLTEIIASRPTEAEPLRTRATVRVFKEDFEGAAMDLTAALQVHRFHRPSSHSSRSFRDQASSLESHESQPASDGQQHRNGRREDVILREEEQPSSFEQQVLFQRGGVYLTLACQYVTAALMATSRDQADREGQAVENRAPLTPPPEPALGEVDKKVMEARKLVKSYARKALRDYMAFLGHFDYSPDVPIEVAEDFAKRVNHAVHGLRIPRSQQHMSRSDSHGTNRSADGPTTPPKVYKLSDLFAAAPPADLPPYPRTDMVTIKPTRPSPPLPQPETSTESLTYHPLQTDALHSLLLCHCLVQTSSKELQRHANMVARLARLADGYPVFQASRSPARADWVEILRRGENWIHLSGTWEALCAPAPLPLLHNPNKAVLPIHRDHESGLVGELGTTIRTERNGTLRKETEKERQERHHHQAMLAALNDDRVTDMESLRAAVRAHKRRNEEDERLVAKGLEPGLGAREEEEAAAGEEDDEALDEMTDSLLTALTPANKKAAVAELRTQKSGQQSQSQSQAMVPRRWAIDDGKEYPILTERAAAVARWVLEAPVVVSEGARKRKKKPTKAGGSAARAETEVESTIGPELEQ